MTGVEAFVADITNLHIDAIRQRGQNVAAGADDHPAPDTAPEIAVPETGVIVVTSG